MKKGTKIIATISDKKCDVEFLTELFEEGMNVVRLNTAHQSHADAQKVIDNVRLVSDKIALLIDTKGPEIRTTGIQEDFFLSKGAHVKIIGSNSSLVEENTFAVSYEFFVQDIQVGNRILIDDGDLELLVIDKTKDYLLVEAQNEGYLKNRKSVNIPGVSINLPSLSDKDREFIQFAIDQDIDFIAHSFVRKKEDVIEIQKILDARESKIKIIAKIENQEGVDNIDEILEYVYGVMVARGDLAIEIPAAKIPVIQRRIVRKCIDAKKSVIIATQMLHSMIENPRPTRAEVSDIANAIYNRTDAIMLSGETAYGDYPVEAVKVMTEVAKEVEKELLPDKLKREPRHKEVTSVLARSAVNASQFLPIKAIVTDTLTGRTGRYLSAYRGNVPVYALCYSKRVMRELALSYGVEADYKELLASRDEFVKEAILTLMGKGYFTSEDSVIILGGSFGPSKGVSFMEVSNVYQLTHKV
ncbi:pyruvate kinase [Ancylomarina euxinus]|uniref:Pyruvate kinase n=1 Tax=Ancylomarina euxinus TaxID=2283627 RepID=A0A425XX96_9BACT|nr:pyruvate kinase [Ancylomarina euxinus]MCZ4696150.1 pyruvate kinase [Ancylomarina euxinus]MUP16559.1 pyruvate kinase [Ancylomarina euxinus]RRG19264.1 pyruvate kinase [Ancylomarina euxinus]